MPYVAPLFVPGDRPDRFAKAAATDTDAVIIDLEDAVAPTAKARARDAVVAARMSTKPFVVRINGLETTWWDDDLKAAAQSKAAAVMVPKAESPSALRRVRQSCGADRGIIPLIESAAGLVAAADLLRCPGVSGAAFGSLDFANDLGCEHDWDALMFARSQLVLASRLCDRAAPIDGITADFSNGEAAGDDATRARRLGFGGKLTIHPRQVTPVLLAFHPSAEDVAWAERILGAAAADGGVTSAAAEMIDQPIVDRAKRILAQGRRA